MKPLGQFEHHERRQEFKKEFGRSKGEEDPIGVPHSGARNEEVWEEESVKECCDNNDPEILNERLEALVDNMEPSEKEVKDKVAVLRSLTRVLSNRFPEVELTPYGSSESSLAFSGSDLDIFVWLGDEEEVILNKYFQLGVSCWLSQESLGGYFDEVEYGKSITKQVAQLLSGHPSKYAMHRNYFCCHQGCIFFVISI